MISGMLAVFILACLFCTFFYPVDAEAAFGCVPVENAADIIPVIESARASGLLSPDEHIVFDADAEFNRGSYYKDIVYYYDDSLLAVAWKRLVDGNTVTMLEVKLADPSQLHRYLTEDRFGGATAFLSDMVTGTDAVAAINTDCYSRREFGTVVYDGEICRFDTRDYGATNDPNKRYYYYNCLDTCFVTRSGDFIFSYFGEPFTYESLNDFIRENDISFSLAFGPVLVDDYEVRDHYVGWYPAGEVDDCYSRVGIGQVDSLHYLYASVNHSSEKDARWTVRQFADLFASLGVRDAYTLDGGQTGELIINGDIYNHIDFGEERHVSDMIYFTGARHD